MTSTSTPREALYIETGIKDPEYTITQKRLAMRCRKEKTQNETITAILEIDDQNTGNNNTDKLMRNLNIDKIRLKAMRKTQQQKVSMKHKITT